MEQEFIADLDVYRDRDQLGTVRQLRHVDAPFASPTSTPQLAAADYLHSFGDLLELTAAELENLSLQPASQPEDAGVELRYLGEKQQFDTATVAYNQTALGLPVFEAGGAVHRKNAPVRAPRSPATHHPHLHLPPPPAHPPNGAQS